ncbi:MAG: polyhydroxyalkanoate synthesis regulator DNA-binding domain-containing protein [Thermodesulfobacteriota bacterium]
MADPLKLKKYTNRRLYDTERSVYVTLSEISEVIKAGRRVEVVDAKTSEDVTAFILTQIILEEGRNHHSFLPIPFLHMIIQYGNLLSEFFEKYLLKTFQVYLIQKESFDSQFMRWIEVGADFSQMAQKTAERFKPFQSFLNGFSGGKNSDSEPPENPA